MATHLIKTSIQTQDELRSLDLNFQEHEIKVVVNQEIQMNLRHRYMIRFAIYLIFYGNSEWFEMR